MNVEQLANYRDEFHRRTMVHNQLNEKWKWLSALGYLASFALIIIPAAIFGDNNGQERPFIQVFLMILGAIILCLALISTGFYIYHKLVIKKYKNYKEMISRELSDMSVKKLEKTDKKFPFIK